MFDKLFEPMQIRGMELRNRVVMSAMKVRKVKMERVLQIS